MNALPPPFPQGSPSFWNQINSKEEIDKWSNAISKATQYLWEAQIRQGEGHLWPNQSVDLFNGRAILVKLTKLKSSLVKNEIVKGLRGLEAAKLTDALKSLGITFDPNNETEFLRNLDDKLRNGAEEVGKLCRKLKLSLEDVMDLAFDNFSADYRQIQQTIRQDRYLASLDPGQDIKLRIIERFFETEGKPLDPKYEVRLDSWKDTFNYTDTHEYSYIRNLNQLKYGHSPETYKDAKTLDTKSLVSPYFAAISQPDQKSKQLVLPATIIDLRRHTIMTQCLLRPDYSIY